MRYFKDVGIFTLAQAVGALLAFLYTLATARLLGVGQFGLFQALLGVYGVMAAFCLPLNLTTLHCVGVAAADHKPRVVGEFITLALWLSGICSLILIVFAPWIAKIVHSGSVLPVLSIAVLLITTALLTTFYGALQARTEFWRFSIARFLQALGCLIFGVFFIISGGGVPGAIAGHWVSMAMVLCIFFMNRDLIVFSRDFSHIRTEFRAILRILAVFGTLLIIDNAPVIAARIFLDEHASGIYGALYNFRNTIWPFAFAITLPFYAHLLSSSNPAGMVKRALGLIGLLAILFIGIGLICAELIFRILYGPAFIEAAPFMAPYGLSLFFQMLAMVLMFYQAARKTVRWFNLAVPVFLLLTGLIFYGQSIPNLIMVQGISAFSYVVLLGLDRGLHMLQTQKNSF